jgi:hypothetical protein
MKPHELDAKVAAAGLREAIDARSWELVEHYTEKVEHIARGEAAFPYPGQLELAERKPQPNRRGDGR